MNSITLEQFMSFITENIISDEKHSKDVLRYFLTEFKGTEGEYVYTTVEPVQILEQCDNLFIPNINVYINVKKTTIFIVACFFDLYCTRGFAAGLGTITGLIEKSIHIIKPENVCLFSRITYYEKYFSGATVKMLEKEYDGSCNSICCKRCPHRGETGSCDMNSKRILDGISDLLLSKTISIDAQDTYHLN